jgi:hypothetical protein
MGVQVGVCVVVIGAQLAVCVSSISSHKKRGVTEEVAITASLIDTEYISFIANDSVAVTLAVIDTGCVSVALGAPVALALSVIVTE